MATDLQIQAENLFKLVTLEDWPGYKVKWTRTVSYKHWATTDFNKKIILLSRELKDMPLSLTETLLHEFAHVILYDDKHGKKFVDTLRWLQLRLLYIQATGNEKAIKSKPRRKTRRS